MTIFHGNIDFFIHKFNFDKSTQINSYNLIFVNKFIFFTLNLKHNNKNTLFFH